jgi:hypothetical protein
MSNQGTWVMLGKWPMRIVEAFALPAVAAIARQHNAKSALGRHGRALACSVPESQASDALAPGVSDVNAVGSKIGALARPNKPDRGKSEGSPSHPMMEPVRIQPSQSSSIIPVLIAAAAC